MEQILVYAIGAGLALGWILILWGVYRDNRDRPSRSDYYKN